MTLGLWGGILVILVVAALFGVLYYFLKRNLRNHEADAVALSAWATDHGYTYVERDDQTWTKRWHFFPFGTGDPQHADHVVSGKYGDLEFAAFDYNFTNYGATGSGSSSATLHFAMVVVKLAQSVPYFDARKRQHHLLPPHEANEFALGDKAFDDKYIVHADDQTYATSALVPSLLAMIVSQKLQGIHVVDGRLFAWVDQTHNKVATLPGRLAAIVEGAAALPSAPGAS